jgi:hypothetical protein
LIPALLFQATYWVGARVRWTWLIPALLFHGSNLAAGVVGTWQAADRFFGGVETAALLVLVLVASFPL